MALQTNTKSDFAKFIKLDKLSLRQLAYASRSWFQGKIAKLTKRQIQRGTFLRRNTTTKLKIGKMYLYRYKPKYEATLDIWDEYPLVLPFRSTENGFIGINLHYLPPKQRAWLLFQLTRTMTEKNKNKQLRVSWDILNSFSRVNVGEYATHRYLMDHIASPIREIEADDFANVIMLPMQRWHLNENGGDILRQIQG